MTIPYRLANGPGNAPDADKFMANYDYLTALAFGNQMKNGGFETWLGGTSFTNPANASAVATGWTWLKSGTSTPTADVSREASVIDTGTYSGKVNITVAGSSNSLTGFYQVIPNSAWFRGFTVLTGFRVKLSTANKARVKITDGTTTAYSSYHTGGGAWENLQATLLVGAGATSVTVSVEITSDFTGAIYVDSSYSYVIPDSMASGAKSYLEHIIFMSQKLSVEGGDIYGNLATNGSNISMGGGKVTGAGEASANGDLVRWEQLFYMQAPVQATTTTQTTTISTSFVDSSLTASITPSSSSNRVKITATVYYEATAGGTDFLTIKRNSTALGGTDGLARVSGTSSAEIDGMVTLSFIDSPATTSSVTYTVAGKTGGANTLRFGGTTNVQAAIILEEVK